MVLKLGMVCSQSEPRLRPTMRQVVQCLEGDMPVQDLCSSLGISLSGLKFTPWENFDGIVISYASSVNQASSVSSYAADSIRSGGR